MTGGEERETLKNHPARKWKESEMHLLMLPVKNQKLMYAYERSWVFLFCFYLNVLGCCSAVAGQCSTMRSSDSLVVFVVGTLLNYSNKSNKLK